MQTGSHSNCSNKTIGFPQMYNELHRFRFSCDPQVDKGPARTTALPFQIIKPNPSQSGKVGMLKWEKRKSCASETGHQQFLKRLCHLPPGYGTIGIIRLLKQGFFWVHKGLHKSKSAGDPGPDQDPARITALPFLVFGWNPYDSMAVQQLYASISCCGSVLNYFLPYTG